jgi:hypothetical protein
VAGVSGAVDTATPPPPDFRGFVRAVAVFGVALIILAAMFGNAH